MKKNKVSLIRLALISGIISLMFTGCLSRFDVFDPSNNLQSIQERIEAGDDINAQDARGKTVLYVAAESGKLDIVEYLVSKGADVNIETDDGYTPLIIASQNAHFEIIKHLVENGANINHQMKNNNYALYQLVGYQDQDSDKDYLGMVKYMVEHGANYNLTGFNNYTLLQASREVAIVEYLRELGMDIHAVTVNNATSLIGSIANAGKGTELTKYFIDNCVNLHTVAAFGNTRADAYTMAINFGRTESAELIKEAMEKPTVQCYAFQTLAPLIEFYNLPESSDDYNASVNIKITNQASGIGKVKIYFNNTELDIKQLAMLKDDENSKVYKLKLDKSPNEIKVEVFEEKNIVRNSAVFHTVAETVVVNKPKMYAIIIGIDTFKDKKLNLKYAQADSLLFGSTLFKRSREIFDDVSVVYLNKEKETTKEAILKELKKLENTSKDDVFVFYSATNATIVNDAYYMVTSNVSSTDENTIKNQALSQEDLKNAFEKIPALNKLLLFDTDYSDLVNNAILEKLNSNKLLNLASMSAVNSTHTSRNDYGNKHGIFSYVLSDALDGEADSNNNGIVDSSEFIDYATKTIPIESKQYKHVQTPVNFESGQIFNISKIRGNLASTEVEEIDNIEETFASEQTFEMDALSFVLKDDSISIDTKDKVKEHFARVNADSQNQIVFDFYSKNYIHHAIKTIKSKKISKIEIGFHNKFYRVVFYTKTKHPYSYKTTENGISITLED